MSRRYDAARVYNKGYPFLTHYEDTVPAAANGGERSQGAGGSAAGRSTPASHMAGHTDAPSPDADAGAGAGAGASEHVSEDEGEVSDWSVSDAGVRAGPSGRSRSGSGSGDRGVGSRGENHGDGARTKSTTGTDGKARAVDDVEPQTPKRKRSDVLHSGPDNADADDTAVAGTGTGASGLATPPDSRKRQKQSQSLQARSVSPSPTLSGAHRDARRDESVGPETPTKSSHRTHSPPSLPRSPANPFASVGLGVHARADDTTRRVMQALQSSRSSLRAAVQVRDLRITKLQGRLTELECQLTTSNCCVAALQREVAGLKAAAAAAAATTMNSTRGGDPVESRRASEAGKS